MYSGCGGCGRYGVIDVENFPDDYPKNMMLCCACTSSYYDHLRISNIPKYNGFCYTGHFCVGWWSVYGEGIEKVMRII